MNAYRIIIVAIFFWGCNGRPQKTNSENLCLNVDFISGENIFKYNCFSCHNDGELNLINGDKNFTYTYFSNVVQGTDENPVAKGHIKFSKLTEKEMKSVYCYMNQKAIE